MTAPACHILQNGQSDHPASAATPPAKAGLLLPLPHPWPAQEQQKHQQRPLQGPSTQPDSHLAHIWWQQQPPLEQQQAGGGLSDSVQEVWLRLQLLQQALSNNVAPPVVPVHELRVAAGLPPPSSVQHLSAAEAFTAHTAMDTALGLLGCGTASAAPAAAAPAGMPAPGGASEASEGGLATAAAAAVAAALDAPLAGGAGSPSQYTAVVQVDGRWHARWLMDGQLHSRGPFDAVDGAAAAYDRAVLAQMGALLSLNFPLENYIKI